MSELFRPGTTIPKGYTLAVTSWENDGDHYDTIFIKGLEDKNIVNQVLHVLRWFSHARDDMGNDQIAHEEILCRLYDAYHAGVITEKYFNRFLCDVELPPLLNSDENFDEWLETVVKNEGYDEVADMVREFLGCAIEYDYDHARVVSDVRVYFFDTPFEVPPAPKHLINFDGSWKNRADQSEWTI